MKWKLFVLFSLFLSVSRAQDAATPLPPSPEKWNVFNREVHFAGQDIVLNENDGDGILWIRDLVFSNGVIELDIRGKDEQGKSFVGVAFHGEDNTTFDGVYFRPFNFRSRERGTHAVQYIAMPDHDWSQLRKDFPEQYENPVHPVPDPNDWFHAKVVVEYPAVKVFVNGASTPSLEVTQLSKRKTGSVGVWVGNGSEGRFRNVTILGR